MRHLGGEDPGSGEEPSGEQRPRMPVCATWRSAGEKVRKVLGTRQ